jgi:hypothetical protein
MYIDIDTNVTNRYIFIVADSALQFDHAVEMTTFSCNYCDDIGGKMCGKVPSNTPSSNVGKIHATDLEPCPINYNRT